MRKIMKFKFDKKKITGIIGGIRFNDELAYTDKSGFVLFVAMFKTGRVIGGYRYKCGRMTPYRFIEWDGNDELEQFILNEPDGIPDEFVAL